jgi:hypothetical protein
MHGTNLLAPFTSAQFLFLPANVATARPPLARGLHRVQHPLGDCRRRMFSGNLGIIRISCIAPFIAWQLLG